MLGNDGERSVTMHRENFPHLTTKDTLILAKTTYNSSFTVAGCGLACQLIKVMVGMDAPTLRSNHDIRRAAILAYFQ